MEKEHEVNATVNENEDEKIANQKQQDEANKAGEKAPWKFGPISINRPKDKTVKRLKIVGAGVITIFATALGVKVGGWCVGTKKDEIIKNMGSEISKLKAAIDAAPEMIETATEVVAEAAEAVPETIVEVVSEE